MDKCVYSIIGEISSSLDTRELLSLLNRYGVSSSLSDSCHSRNSIYISIQEGVPRFSLENWDGKYAVTGYSLSYDRMCQATEKVSDVLIYLDISHVFEIYACWSKSNMEELVCYLEHNCLMG
jgi:hypothetical protein